MRRTGGTAQTHLLGIQSRAFESILRSAREQRASLWHDPVKIAQDGGAPAIHAHLDPIYCVSFGSPIVGEGTQLRAKVIFGFELGDAVLTLPDGKPLLTFREACASHVDEAAFGPAANAGASEPTDHRLYLDKRLVVSQAIQVNYAMQQVPEVLHHRISSSPLVPTAIAVSPLSSLIDTYLSRFGQFHQPAPTSSPLQPPKVIVSRSSPLRQQTQSPGLVSPKPLLGSTSVTTDAPDSREVEQNTPVLVRAFRISCPQYLMLATRLVRGQLRSLLNAPFSLDTLLRTIRRLCAGLVWPLCTAILEAVKTNGAFHKSSGNRIHLARKETMQSLVSLHSGVVLLHDVLAVETASLQMLARDTSGSATIRKECRSLLFPVKLTGDTILGHIFEGIRHRIIKKVETLQHLPKCHFSPHSPSRGSTSKVLHRGSMEVNPVAWAAGWPSDVLFQTLGSETAPKKGNDEKARKQAEGTCASHAKATFQAKPETLPALSRTALAVALAQSLGDGSADLPSLPSLYEMRLPPRLSIPPRTATFHDPQMEDEIRTIARGLLRVQLYRNDPATRRGSVPVGTSLHAIGDGDKALDSVVNSDPALASLMKLFSKATSQLWGPWPHLKHTIHACLSPQVRGVVEDVVEQIFRDLTTTPPTLNPQTIVAILAGLPTLVTEVVFLGDASQGQSPLPLSPLQAVSARADASMCAALISQHPLLPIILARIPAYAQALVYNVKTPEVPTEQWSSNTVSDVEVAWERNILPHCVFSLVQSYRSLVLNHNLSHGSAALSAIADPLQSQSPLAHFVFGQVTKIFGFAPRAQAVGLVLSASQLAGVGPKVRWQLASRCQEIVKSLFDRQRLEFRTETQVQAAAANWDMACELDAKLAARLQAVGSSAIESQEDPPLPEEFEDEADELRSRKAGPRAAYELEAEDAGLDSQSGGREDKSENTQSGCGGWLKRLFRTKGSKVQVLDDSQAHGRITNVSRADLDSTDEAVTKHRPPALPLRMVSSKSNIESEGPVQYLTANQPGTQPTNVEGGGVTLESVTDMEEKALGSHESQPKGVGATGHSKRPNPQLAVGRSQREAASHVALKLDRLAAWISIFANSDYGDVETTLTEVIDAFLAAVSHVIQANWGGMRRGTMVTSSLARFYTALIHALGFPRVRASAADLTVISQDIHLPQPRIDVGAALFYSSLEAQLWTEIACSLRHVARTHRKMLAACLDAFNQLSSSHGRNATGPDPSNRIAEALNHYRTEVIASQAAMALLPADPRVAWMFATRLSQRLRYLKHQEHQTTINISRLEALYHLTMKTQARAPASDEQVVKYQIMTLLEKIAEHRQSKQQLASQLERTSTLSTRWLLELDRRARDWRRVSVPGFTSRLQNKSTLDTQLSATGVDSLETNENGQKKAESLQDTHEDVLPGQALPNATSPSGTLSRRASRPSSQLDIEEILSQAEKGKLPREILSYMLPDNARLLVRLGRTAARSCLADLVLIVRLEAMFNPIVAECLGFRPEAEQPLRVHFEGSDRPMMRSNVPSLLSLIALAAREQVEFVLEQ